MLSKLGISVLILAAGLAARTSFAVSDPAASLLRARQIVEERALDDVHRLLPLVKEANFITELNSRLARGKYDAYRFSDFLGAVTGTTYLKGRYYAFTCDAFVTLRVDTQGHITRPDIVLEDDGPSRLVARHQVTCQLDR